MNRTSMIGYNSSQKLYPLSLLAQLTSRYASGCFQVISGSASWSIYFDQGKLAFATNTLDPFERLDRQLRQLSRQVPSLVSAVRVQVRLLFESAQESAFAVSRDYRAITWLVEQEYLTAAQATTLIEEIAKEVLESFLTLTEGSYGTVAKEQFERYPQLCLVELRPLVESCQIQLTRRQSAPPAPAPNPQDGISSTTTSLSQSVVPDRSTSTKALPTGLSNSASQKAQSSAESGNKSHYKIACIDDSPTVLEAIRCFLDDASFSVLMINDPVKALMQVVRNKPDLILLDVGMPSLDGYELCSLLRRHPSFKITPIIMVTGNTGFIDRAKAKLAGASGYLTKPFTQSDLLKMVFKHLT